MKVRILSGNQTGAVVDMPKLEAEANIATGYAEAVEEVTVVAAATVAHKAEPEKKLTPAELKRRAREEDENDDRL